MRVAIIHYHLRSGGVSRVIQHAVSSLEGHDVQPVVLVGEKPTDGAVPHEKIKVIEGIDYSDHNDGLTAEIIAERLVKGATEALGGAPDVWHFHNHSMGKNCALTEAVSVLARQNHRILLQLHDFPEDGRPHLFKDLRKYLGKGQIHSLGELMYPQATHIHYATINSRDMNLLADLGVDRSILHLIPNAATLECGPSDEWNPSPEGGKLILYPIRAIRRKNVGEFLLWSAFAGPDARFAVTLAPKSAADRIAYEHWIKFSAKEKLPVEFEVGMKDDTPFAERLKSAWIAVTTSVAEGFGLTFVEPWLVNRPVVGRRIPEIDHEFTDAGIDLSGLYEKLLVPLDWIDSEALRARIQKVYRAMLSTYDRELQPHDVDRALAAACEGDRIDFGRLDEKFQSEIILRLKHSPESRSEMQPDTFVPRGEMHNRIEQNRKAVIEHYSLEKYGNRLMDIYKDVANSETGEVDQGLPVQKILDAFLSPERFFLLRT